MQTKDIAALARLPLGDQLIAVRRMLHRHAEPGWCEINTATLVARLLAEYGLEVRLGAEVIDGQARMGVPDPAVLETYHAAAIAAGADPQIAGRLRGGYTGVVGILRGSAPGPTLAFRFDLDANMGSESKEAEHPPVRGGFASIHDGVHHNCGHDGHTSIGLGLARRLAAEKDRLRGEIRLIFQPAEEGLRGAAAMVAAGVLKDVDHFFGIHIGVQALKLGEIITGYDDILGSTKLDVEFFGRASHAAISPHLGRNAVAAACQATLAYLAIPRHGDGDTRVNVGLISGGDSRNAIPSRARISLELRSDKKDALAFLEHRAQKITEGIATANEVTFEIRRMGESRPASSDRELSELIGSIAGGIAGVTDIRGHVAFKGSDDAAEMMLAVQEAGGKAVYVGLGSALGAEHHNPRFDFEEAVMPIGVDLLFGAARTLCGPK
jgi:aminobenzoyl-glutamate utilization protein A